MKKSLIALAVVATVAAPMAASAASHAKAGSPLYASIRAQIVSTDGLSITDGSSRWGVKGSHDLGNGLSGIYRFEYALNSADAKDSFVGRLGYAGVSGGFGTVALGEQWSPYYNAVSGSSDLFVGGGLPFSPSPFRLGNMFTYAMPSSGPVSGAIGIVMNGKAGKDEDGNAVADDDDIDAINAGVNFAAGPMTIGLGMHDVEGAADTLVGLSVGGTFGDAGVTLLVEDSGDNTPWALTGTFGAFLAQYSDDDVDDTAVTLGYTHKLGTKTKLQFTVQDVDSAADTKVVARMRVDL